MNVFLTGGSRGIGKEIKNIFLLNDHKVFSPTREEMNLTNISEVEKFLSHFSEDVDILINNAGINEPNSILDISAEELINDFNTNFLSHFLISQFFLKKFIQNKKGIILNIGSIRITELKEKRFKYTLSKTSIHTLTKYIVKEASKYNIICNTISPGYVETDMLYRNNDEEKIKEMIESVPIKRLVSPKEISELVYFLSTKNNCINGQNIIIDGGLTCL